VAIEMVTEQQALDEALSGTYRSDLHRSGLAVDVSADGEALPAESLVAPVSAASEPEWLRNSGDLVACAIESQRLVVLARRVAASDCTVLISG